MNLLRFAFVLFLMVAALPVSASAQSTWIVDQQGGETFSKIQDCIDDPQVLPGDTCLVHPGTYVENIDFHGKDISVKSSFGPEVTIIDGNHADPVVKFASSETPEAVIDGFTIQNGVPGPCCTIMYDTDNGAGIHCENSSPTINNCKITKNINGWANGGGIWCPGPCIISSCTIWNNVTEGSGAGIFAGPDTIITHCIIGPNNQGLYSGGGISGGQITDCLIFGNYGGGIALPTFLTNSTIYGNDGAYTGGGIWADVNIPITNCIVWGNTAYTGPQQIAGTPIVTYSDVEGGYAGIGNIDLPPQFVTGPLGDYYLSQTASGQAEDSPCVNTGDPATEDWGWTSLTTRTDQQFDAGIVDTGYHYPRSCTDNDGDGYSIEGGACGPIDCDDTNPNVHPGATEICNGFDDNCDGQIDEEPAASISCQNGNLCDGLEYCSSESCHPGTPLNCDDGNACTNDSCDPATGCTHLCNATGPNDPCCANSACSGNPICQAPACIDKDGDGYGNPASRSCPHPQLDCNDSNPDINPGSFALMSPSNGARLSSPPTFQWNPGCFDYFKVYLYGSHIGLESFWLPAHTTSFPIPAKVWHSLKTRTPYHWAILGVNSATKDWKFTGTWSFIKMK